MGRAACSRATGGTEVFGRAVGFVPSKRAFGTEPAKDRSTISGRSILLRLAAEKTLEETIRSSSSLTASAFNIQFVAVNHLGPKPSHFKR
jgi:hypothetical protein